MRINRPNSRASVTSTVPVAAAFALLAMTTAACGTASENAGERRTPASIVDSTSSTEPAESSTSTTDAEPDDLAFTEPTEPEPTTTEAPTTTQAPTTTEAPTTTQAPTTTAPPAIELASVVIMDKHNFGWVAADPESEAELKRQVLDAFASKDLDWSTDTVYLHQNEPTWEQDGGGSTLFLATAETSDGVAHADVTEIISTAYFRDGVEVGQEGHTCVFWSQCPAGVTVDDYEFKRVVYVEMGDIDVAIGGCVVGVATMTAIRECSVVS